MHENPQELILEHLQRHAARYCPEVATKSITVNMQARQSRTLSCIYGFSIEADSLIKSIIVKLPSPVQLAGKSTRPRLKSLIGDSVKFKREHAAMSAVHAHFLELNDPRFSGIRVLDFVTPLGALVMERSDSATLRDLLVRQCWRGRHKASEDICRAVANAGSWLREFHAMDMLPGSRSRNNSRESFIASISPFFEYLHPKFGRNDEAGELMDEILAAADKQLPKDLPTAMGHGDFAPRNILIGPGSRVSVIDTIGTWQPAIYEDLGFFLSSIRTSRLQALTLNLAMSAPMLDQVESSFLAGYFGKQRDALPIVHLFAIQAVLDRWCANEERIRNAARERRWHPATLASTARNTFFRREIARRLRLLNN